MLFHPSFLLTKTCFRATAEVNNACCFSQYSVTFNHHHILKKNGDLY